MMGRELHYTNCILVIVEAFMNGRCAHALKQSVINHINGQLTRRPLTGIGKNCFLSYFCTGDTPVLAFRFK